jgi:predicted RNase H-like HicB family nuclease
MESLFTAVFQKTDKWGIAFVEELHGANAQGETIDEARENLKEAVELILEANLT